jgi:tetratricopeptide (TPR) repeat protein
MNDIANAIEILQRRVSADADDAESRYKLAVLFLAEYGRTYEPEWLSPACEHLAAAIKLRPNHAQSHAALGYAYDFTKGGGEQALACFREARRLNPQDRVCDVYFLKLLEQTGRNSEVRVEIKAAALRYDVDLPALRRKLRAAGMPTDARTLLINGFSGPRFKSLLADKAERILNTLAPGRARMEAAAERARCSEDQRQLERTFDSSRVPESVRALAHWAGRYGVGDDDCRTFLLRRLSKKQRAALTHEIDENADSIHAWLDSFGDALMPLEAAAFMYLALGVEEIREQS